MFRQFLGLTSLRSIQIGRGVKREGEPTRKH